MPAKRNGPLAGMTHGTDWDRLPPGKPKKYKGTANGAKANVYRANKMYPELKFRSFQLNQEVYIERMT